MKFGPDSDLETSMILEPVVLLIGVYCRRFHQACISFTSHKRWLRFRVLRHYGHCMQSVAVFNEIISVEFYAE